MLLNKHKNHLMVGMTSLGIVLTFGMAFLGTKIDLIGENTVSANQFASYGIVDVKTAAHTAANGLQSESLNFEFAENNGQSSDVIDENGFAAMNSALKNSIEKEPAIFNVHGVGEPDGENMEFIFESVSPSDYESNVFRQAYTPFSRLANSGQFSDVKYLSTIEDSGARSIVAGTQSSREELDGKDAEDMWGTMLIVLAPIIDNTSYKLTMGLPNNITVHGTLSTDAEQKKMMESDSGDNWEGALALKERPGVKNVDLYMQGQDTSYNTVAVTIEKPASIDEYVEELIEYSQDEDNEFPHDYTVALTVEGEATPAHVFYPGK